jgi:hypothetical protein
MLRAAAFVFLGVAVAGVTGCSQQPQAGCSLSGGDINCDGETFDMCTVAGCSIGALNCSSPPTGCRIAPGMVLGHYQEKGPNAFFLCCDPLTNCGTWTEASCQVTITSDSPITSDAGVSTTYAFHDSTCP